MHPELLTQGVLDLVTQTHSYLAFMTCAELVYPDPERDHSSPTFLSHLESLYSGLVKYPLNDKILFPRNFEGI